MVEARGRAVVEDARRIAVNIPLLVISGVVGGAGIIGLLAALVLALQPVIGTAASLAIAATLGTLLALLMALIAVHRLPGGGAGQSDTAAEAEAEAATERFRQQAGLSDDSAASDGADEDQPSLTERAIDAALERPDAVGAAALALVGVVGPGRALRILTRGAAAASAVSTVVRSIQQDHDKSSDRSRQNGRIDCAD